jgi:hypothetical protein
MACNDYFQPYINWLQKNPGPGEVSAFRYWVSVIGVANRPNQGCYYLEGVLDTYDGTQMIGHAIQYFNDRAPGNNPFNPNATDQVGLTLTLPDGPLTMTLESWGNALMQYTLECPENQFVGGPPSRPYLLYGYAGDIALIISLGEKSMNI